MRFIAQHLERVVEVAGERGFETRELHVAEIDALPERHGGGWMS